MTDYTPELLVVEDDVIQLEIVKSWLEQWDFKTTVCSNGADALHLLTKQPFDIVLLDLILPEVDGLEILKERVGKTGSPEFIVMTLDRSIDTAVRAMKIGAADYLSKPLNFEHLSHILQKTLEARQQKREAFTLKSQLLHGESFEGLIGVCPAMQAVYNRIMAAASNSSPVLIQGETGTGKELVAQAIHRLSAASDGEMLAVNCAALPDDLLQAELFGYEKGAFTGAGQARAGLMEKASGGTLFLDEIQQMTPQMQAALLRSVEQFEIRRLGGDRTISVDFRLTCSTNASLDSMLKEGTFRDDLFYRISTLPIYLPPLRERQNDIMLLAGHFLKHSHGGRERRLTDRARAWMLTFDWPGNVRQLKHAIDRALALGHRDILDIEDLHPNEHSATAAGHPLGSLKQASEDFERRYLTELLALTEGNITEAAKQAGLNRQYFYRKLKNLGITH